MKAWLSRSDAAWWHMDEPFNPMVITGVMRFDTIPESAQVRDRVVERLMAQPRFRQRVREALGGPFWASSELDLAWHVQDLEVADEPSFLEVVGRLLGTPLDRTRPLWQIHLARLPQGAAVIIRIHHCVGDGVAMMNVLSGLADPESRAPVLAHAGAHPAWGVKAWGRACLDLVGGVLLKREPAFFQGSLSSTKRASISQPLDLARVKQAGRLEGATVNDVLLSSLAGAFRGYLLERGQEPRDLRMVMPVDLRAPHDDAMGNRFGLAFVPLPVGYAEPRQRLEETKRRLDRLKGLPQAAIIYQILRLAGWLPVWAELALVRLFGSRGTAVATNVRGMAQPLAMGGQTLRELMFWVPQSGRLGLGVSIISYAGLVRVGVAADAAVAPCPERLVDHFHGAFEELAALHSL